MKAFIIVDQSIDEVARKVNTMDMELTVYYNSFSTTNGPLGYRWTHSANLLLQASVGTPQIVTLTRGNGRADVYVGSGGVFAPQTADLLNTLVQDTTHNLWLETTPDGRVTAWPIDTTGKTVAASWVQDSVGNQHLVTYDTNGLLTGCRTRSAASSPSATRPACPLRSPTGPAEPDRGAKG